MSSPRFLQRHAGAFIPPMWCPTILKGLPELAAKLCIGRMETQFLRSAWAWDRYFQMQTHTCWSAAEDGNVIAEQKGFIEIMRHQDCGGPATLGVLP